jgi:hypothetical protein
MVQAPWTWDWDAIFNATTAAATALAALFTGLMFLLSRQSFDTGVPYVQILARNANDRRRIDIFLKGDTAGHWRVSELKIVGPPGVHFVLPEIRDDGYGGGAIREGRPVGRTLTDPPQSLYVSSLSSPVRIRCTVRSMAAPRTARRRTITITAAD